MSRFFPITLPTDIYKSVFDQVTKSLLILSPIAKGAPLDPAWLPRQSFIARTLFVQNNDDLGYQIATGKFLANDLQVTPAGRDIVKTQANNA